MKKIILILLAIVFSFSCVFAEAPDYKKLNGDIAEKKATYENNKTDANKKALQDAEKALDDALKSDPSNLASSAFTIDINTILPSVDMGGNDDTEERTDFILGKVIQNMMIALGALSILVMTIGAGFMILYNGQDEMLSRGKNIIMGGIYAMIAALGSYYLVAIIRYILYTN